MSTGYNAYLVNQHHAIHPWAFTSWEPSVTTMMGPRTRRRTTSTTGVGERRVLVLGAICNPHSCIHSLA